MGYIILVKSVVHDARKFAWAGPFRNAVRIGLDCSRGMECTVQVLVVHCVLKQSSDIVPSPGNMLAPAFSTDREQQQQQQHILTPASAEAAPAKRHAHHCSTHSHACKHTYTDARANTHRRAHIHTHKHTCTHTRAQTHTHTHTCICTHTLRA